MVDCPELIIIPDKLWEAAKRRQAEVGKKNNPYTYRGGRSPKYALSGLLKCSQCGSSYVISGHNQYACASYKNRGVSVCSNNVYINKNLIESAIIPRITGELFNDSFFDDIQSRVTRILNASKDDSKERRNRLEKELKDQETKLDNLIKAIESGIITDTTKTRIEEAENRIKEINEELKNGPKDKPRVAVLDSTIRNLMGRLDELMIKRPQKARAILGKLIDRIDVTNEKTRLKIEITPKDEVITNLYSGFSLSLVAGTGFEPVTFGL
ncbi:MAG: recombinase zinc beta ribbon domain-containing protein [Deltaproteobacteria bacterium]|nr:recombinase zinc beta ribbon domain-containing protein [Candidatus Zymogenaceae bacterium]